MMEAQAAQEAKETQEVRPRQKERHRSAQEVKEGQGSAATGQGCWTTQERRQRLRRQ